MKRLFLVVLLLCAGICGVYSQALQQRNNGVVTSLDQDLFTGRSFRSPVYLDTTAANTMISGGGALDSCGSLIFTRDWNGYWYRACNPKHWVQIFPGGTPETDTLAWKTTLNSFPSSNSSFGTISPTSIRFITNNTTRLILPSTGIVRNNGAATKCMAIDTITGIWYYTDCGSSSWGTVTSFSSGNLSPLFTTNVATATTTPSQTFTLSNANAFTLFGRGSGVGVPSFLSSIDSNWIPTLHSEAYYNTKYTGVGDVPTLEEVLTAGSNISSHTISVPDTLRIGIFSPTTGNGTGIRMYNSGGNVTIGDTRSNANKMIFDVDSIQTFISTTPLGIGVNYVAQTATLGYNGDIGSGFDAKVVTNASAQTVSIAAGDFLSIDADSTFLILPTVNIADTIVIVEPLPNGQNTLKKIAKSDLGLGSQWTTTGSDIYYNTGEVGIGNTSPASKLHITTNSIGETTSETAGIYLENTTAATNVLDQYSPSIVQRGNVWDTDGGGTSRTVEFRSTVTTADNSGGGDGYLVWEVSMDGAPYTTPMYLSHTGALNVNSIAANTVIANNVLGSSSMPGTTDGTNVTASTGNNFTYTRVGNIVMFSGSVTVTTALAVASDLQIALPIASDLVNDTDANATGSSDALFQNIYIKADTANDTLELNFLGTVSGSATIYVSGQYLVQ